jgi:choline kinase
MIILAAGEGKRLRPFTEDKPKCLVKISGKTILDWQIETAKACGIEEIVVVRGYRSEMISYANIKYFENVNYATTNMVASLWTAESVFEDAFIVSYADIIYEPEVLRALIASKTPINVVIDLGWKAYWKKRFENILSDAETLMIDEKGRIRNIGQKPISVDQIQGQYIGLMSFLNEGVSKVRETYEGLQNDRPPNHSATGKTDVNKLFMTDFIQAIIDSGFPVLPVFINRGWVEIDSANDIKIANECIKYQNNKLKIY